MIILEKKLFAVLVSVLAACVFCTLVDCQHNQNTQTRSRRAVSGNTLRVKAGENLQLAIDRAEPGDQIVLDAGAIYDSVILPNKPANNPDQYITIQTENFSSIVGEGNRVRPTEHARSMAKIVSRLGKPALATAPQAHHYRFIGIEFTIAPNSPYVYNLLELGSSDYTSYSQFPHHLFFDRCFVHSTGLNTARRGFALNSGETTVVHSHISGFAAAADETQAICGWNGPGPFHIIDNFLEAGGELILFGGADPSVTNLVPSDIEIRRNHFYRPSEWLGKAAIKGTFELKNAKRVVIDGNLLESGILTTAFVITVRNQTGKAPWSTIEDVEVKNNVVKHASSGFNILGTDNEHPSQTARNIRITNNLLLDLVPDNPHNTAFFLQINGGREITVEHNTAQQAGNIITSYGQPTQGFVFRNNIVQYNLYGIVCIVEAPACSNQAFCGCFPYAVIKGNVLIDNSKAVANDPSIQSKYPLGNYFVEALDKIGFVDVANGDWGLSSRSKVRGRATDGGDPGVDMNMLNAAQSAPPEQGNK